MTVQVSTKNYEILIRFNDDGRLGALLRTITSVTEKGVLVTPPKINDAQQLDLEELKDMVTNLGDDDWFVP